MKFQEVKKKSLMAIHSMASDLECKAVELSKKARHHHIITPVERNSSEHHPPARDLTEVGRGGSDGGEDDERGETHCGNEVNGCGYKLRSSKRSGIDILREVVVVSSRRPVVPACVMRQSASITGVLTRGHPQSTKMSKRAYVIDGDLKAIEEVYKEAAKLEWSEEREAFKKALL